MTRPLWLATLLTVIATASQVGISSPQRSATPAIEPSRSLRLVVVLVVDQLRAADLDTHRTRWRGGFRTLLDEGAVFTRAEYSYLHTATCAGHATIATGSLPNRHGLILNRWWERAERRAFNCMEDAAAPHVSYGAPAAGGNSAKRLMVPTLGDRLRTQRPASRVVSLSLKARSAIPLAGHGGDVVAWFDEGARAFVTSTAFAARPAEAVQRFIARDAPERDLGAIWALRDDEASYQFGDLRVGERPKSGWAALFPHALIGVDGADSQYFDRWQKSPFSDAFLARMALGIRSDIELGAREGTDYLAISFSGLDLMGHDFGPDSREAEDALLRLDDTVGSLLRQLDAAIGRDRYVVALTSDHGVAPIPEQVHGGRIASEDLLQLLEQTLTQKLGRRSESYIAWVGPGAVYFADGVFDRLRAEPAVLHTVIDTLASVPGVQRVIRSDTLSAGGTDPLARAARAGYVADRSGDLLIVPKRHWIFELRSEGDATNHGTFHEYDRRVPLVLRGRGIRPGRYTQPVTPADVAPTLAELAGVRLPEVDGRVLRESISRR